MAPLPYALSPDMQNAAAVAAAAFLYFFVLSLSRPFPLLRALVLLPSTFCHELAHLVVGFLTGGRPSGFSIIPRRREERTLFGRVRTSWLLGSVTLSRPGVLSCFPTGFAPLVLLPAAWFLCLSEPFPGTFAGRVAGYAAAAIVAGGALPSRQDIAVAFSNIGGAVLYTSAIAASLLFFLQR